MPNDQPQPSAPRPHLIHIGYAKSGSSFLRRWFAEHPDIAYRPNRVAGIGGYDDLAGDAAGILLRVTSSETLAAPLIPRENPRPGTFRAAQANVCNALAELFPAAHLLIVTRGFRSMIMSSYSQYVRSGGAKSLQEMAGDAHQEDPWDYDTLIGMYRARFGNDKVIVLPWELLRDDPAQFVRRIETRFGLGHCPPPPQRINLSLSPEELRWYPRLAAAIGRAPFGPQFRGRLERGFARMSHTNRLAGAVRLLQRVAPAPPVGEDTLDVATIEGFRGKASCLAEDPPFTPYAADYLNDRPA